MGKKASNPVEAFNKEQKKKEIQKQKRNKEKKADAELIHQNPEILQSELHRLTQQERSGTIDKKGIKRKQLLSDTLVTIEKKRKEAEAIQNKGKSSIPTKKQLEKRNKAFYTNPQNSVYYHPILNPYGAPPPGLPQKYKINPPGYKEPVQLPPPPPTAPPSGPQRLPKIASGAPPLPREPPPHVLTRPPQPPPLPPGPPPEQPPPPPQTQQTAIKKEEDDDLTKRLKLMKQDMIQQRQRQEEEARQARINALKQTMPPPPPPPVPEEEKEYANAQLRSFVPTALRAAKSTISKPKPNKPVLPATSSEYDSFLMEMKELGALDNT